MSEYDGRGPRYMLAKTEIERVLGMLDSGALEEVGRKMAELDLDIGYLCEFPDVLCSILRAACGKSYVDMIRSASEAGSARNGSRNRPLK